MDEKAAIGIILLVIALFGIMLFFPIYSPAMYGGWGCPMGGDMIAVKPEGGPEAHGGLLEIEASGTRTSRAATCQSTTAQKGRNRCSGGG